MKAVRLVRPQSGSSGCRRGTPLLDAEALQSTPPTPSSPPPPPSALFGRKRADCRNLGRAVLPSLQRLDALLLLLTLACLLPHTFRNAQSLSREPCASPALLPLTFNGYGVNPAPLSMARVYADINANMPRSYWDYDSVNISWGVLENYEVVRKIGGSS
jgi:hypothetical protein